MRTLIVIAAMIMASAAAQAGQSRGLTLASVDEPAATAAQARPADAFNASETRRATDAATTPDAAKSADAPKFVVRPAAVNATPTQSAAPTKVDAAKPSAAQAARAYKPRHRQREWSESRIIGELHRHGIYW